MKFVESKTYNNDNICAGAKFNTGGGAETSLPTNRALKVEDDLRFTFYNRTWTTRFTQVEINAPLHVNNLLLVFS